MTEQNSQALTAENEHLTDIARDLYAERVSLLINAEMNEAQLLGKIEQLLNALEFYAAENNHFRVDMYAESDVMKDEGKRAREVLASIAEFE